MTTYFVADADLAACIRHQGGATLGPTGSGSLAWADNDGEAGLREAVGRPRTSQSLKGAFLPSAESIGRYGSAAAAATVVEAPPAVLLGIRACELRALRYLDRVLSEGQYQDSSYKARRDVATLISVDCAECCSACFCNLVGGLPYATGGFDVNLTPLGDGFLVEVASSRGEQWLAGRGADPPRQATAEELAKRDALRRQTERRLAEQNSHFTFSARDDKATALPDDGNPAWQRFAADCVECAACTNVCPTCHCFYLYDQLLGAEQFERVRTWDSCLLSSYHRMAGTPAMKPTPRPKLRNRLANRILHKFTYSPQQYGLLGCVGCGRCIEACLGAIDIRQVVQELRR